MDAQARGNAVLTFAPAPAGPVDTGDADMDTVDGDVLGELGVAQYFEFRTKPLGTRLTLDNLEAVVYSWGYY